MRLTTRELWNSRHEVAAVVSQTDARARRGLIRRIVDSARQRQGASVGQSYNAFAFHRLMKSHLPQRPDWKVIEIGVAPGHNLVALNKSLGYQPYGVEYSQVGVELARKTFQQHGFDPDHIIEADLLDPAFQDEFDSKFDVVLSVGFIEHFNPPDEVVDAHIKLLKPGGYLVCSIPNLRGICYPFLRLCAREHLRLHNCSLMLKDTFREIFEPYGLDVRYCGHFGAPDLHVSPFRQERSLRGYMARALDRLQDVFEHSMFLFYRGTFPPSRLSASLVFIGQRVS